MNVKKALARLNILKLDLSDKTKRTRWLLRVLSLVLAVVLWIFVTWDGSTLGTREMNIPLKYLDIPDGYSISNTVKDISVVVEGRTEILTLLGRNSITASVSLNDLRPGKYRLPVQLSVPENMRLVSYSPQVVDFSLFRIIQRTLRPSLVIKKGDVPDNLFLENTLFAPPEVVVRGPESDVLAVRKAEVRGTFAELRADAEKELPVILVGDKGEIFGLTVEPRQVRVLASFTENKEEIRVPVRVPLRGKPGENLEVGSIFVSPDAVTLRGSREALSNITDLPLNVIDVSDVTEDIELDVPLHAPGPDIELLGPEHAKVRISLDAATETKTYFNVPVKVQGKGIYKNWKLSPSHISVTIERPVTEGKGQAEHPPAPPLELYVNVSNVVSQQLLLPVLVKDLAQGVKVIRIEPEQITVIALMQ